MTTEQLNSLIRTIMSLVGAFLIGGGAKFFGNVIDTAYWQEIVGAVLAIVSIVWSIRSKQLDIEKFQGFVRQVITFIGGILLAKGVLDENELAAILAFVGAMLPYLQAWLSKKKADQLNQGKISPAQLKQSKP